MLAKKRDGMFLVRESNACAGDYALSMHCKGKLFHYNILECVPSTYRFNNGDKILGKV